MILLMLVHFFLAFPGSTLSQPINLSSLSDPAILIVRDEAKDPEDCRHPNSHPPAGIRVHLVCMHPLQHTPRYQGREIQAVCASATTGGDNVEPEAQGFEAAAGRSSCVVAQDEWESKGNEEK